LINLDWLAFGVYIIARPAKYFNTLLRSLLFDWKALINTDDDTYRDKPKHKKHEYLIIVNSG